MKSLIPWRSKRNDSDLAERSDMMRFRSEMDRLFDRFLSNPFGSMLDMGEAMGQWHPSLDVVEDGDAVNVRVELPGVDPKNVEVSVAGNVLTISGEKKDVTERKGESWFHTERHFGSFRRSLQLPAEVDPEKVSAEHANGVLTVRMEKSPSAKPKRITVKAE